MSEVSIRVENLEKNYGNLKAVKGISFEVESGMIFGMLGPNGAGKTTTIETMIGLLELSGGEMEILGLDPVTELDKLKERIGVQLQSAELFPNLTVAELLELFASFYQQSLSVEKALDMVNLEAKADDKVDNLSGGQHHRLVVALALIANGEIIFLDEPTTGLDPQSRKQLWETILDLKEEGKTIFLTTHYMREAEKLCDKIVIIDQGEVITQGSPDELIAKHFNEETIEISLPEGSQLEEENLKKLPGVNNFEYKKEEQAVILYTEQAAQTIEQLMKNNSGIENLELRKPTLEDLFLKLTGRRIY